MKHKQIYQELLEECRFLGLKVRHCSLSKVCGDYDPLMRQIRMDRELKNTRNGCKVLAHEIMHHKDYIRGFFKDFFYGEPKNIKRVMQAELSASRQAKRFLQYYGLNIEYEEFDFKKNTYLIDHYKKYYFSA